MRIFALLVECLVICSYSLCLLKMAFESLIVVHWQNGSAGLFELKVPDPIKPRVSAWLDHFKTQYSCVC